MPFQGRCRTASAPFQPRPWLASVGFARDRRGVSISFTLIRPRRRQIWYDKLPLQRLKLNGMKQCQSFKVVLPLLSQLHLDTATVALTDTAAHQADRFAPRNQGDDAMMLCLKALG